MVASSRSLEALELYHQAAVRDSNRSAIRELRFKIHKLIKEIDLLKAENEKLVKQAWLSDAYDDEPL